MRHAVTRATERPNAPTTSYCGTSAVPAQLDVVLYVVEREIVLGNFDTLARFYIWSHVNSTQLGSGLDLRVRVCVHV